MLGKFRDREFTFGWIELIIIVAIIFACLLTAYILGYRVGTRSGYDSAMLDAVATIERLPLKEDFNKKSSIEDISNIYARLTEVEDLTNGSDPLPGADPAATTKKSALTDGDANIDLLKADSLSDAATKILPIEKGWYVQIAAPRELKTAEEFVANLKKSGFQGVIEQITIDGEEYFRVLTGPESSKTYADRLRDQVAREEYLKTTPFVREY